MPKVTSKKSLFRVTEKGQTADNKGRIYEGHVGSHNIGQVVAKNMTAGRKKLLTIARKLLK